MLSETGVAISIIVPVYNAEKYLKRCIDSILLQTFTDFELILIDDGSPDCCGKICDEYAIRDNRIRIIHQKNVGQAAARNRGIEISVGGWIHFVDSDDLIHPQMLEILYDISLKSNANIAMCGYEEEEAIPDTFYREYCTPKEYTVSCIDEEKLLNYKDNYKGYYWIVWAKLIRKTLIDRLRFTEGRYYEDNALVCKWLYVAQSVAEVDLPLYFYQINPNGTTKGKFSYKQLDFLWALQEQISFYESIGYDTLRNTMVTAFCNCALAFYNETKRELNDRRTANTIRKDALTIYRKNRKRIGRKDNTFTPVLRMYFPHMGKGILLFKRLIDIIATEGIYGVLQRVKRKMSK